MTQTLPSNPPQPHAGDVVRFMHHLRGTAITGMVVRYMALRDAYLVKTDRGCLHSVYPEYLLSAHTPAPAPCLEDGTRVQVSTGSHDQVDYATIIASCGDDYYVVADDEARFWVQKSDVLQVVVAEVA